MRTEHILLRFVSRSLVILSSYKLPKIISKHRKALLYNMYMYVLPILLIKESPENKVNTLNLSLYFISQAHGIMSIGNKYSEPTMYV